LNPLHGVESQNPANNNNENNNMQRIHYMELKVGIFPSLDLFGGIES
jgi:hypothetical protein